MTENLSFAVIGGSGLYDMQGLTDTREYLPENSFRQTQLANRGGNT